MSKTFSRRTVTVVLAALSLTAVAFGGTGCKKIASEIRKSQKHAAIAFDEKNGGWGYSFDQLTEELAKKAATEKCPSCTVRLTWNQGCGALAQSEKKRDVMTTATGSTRAAAEGEAKTSCMSAAGGGICKVLIYACNSTN